MAMLMFTLWMLFIAIKWLFIVWFIHKMVKEVIKFVITVAHETKIKIEATKEFDLTLFEAEQRRIEQQKRNVMLRREIEILRWRLRNA